MNILVVSDDHGMPTFKEAYELANKKYGKIDMVLHAGDMEGYDKTHYSNIAGCEAYLVRGNNDWSDEPEKRIITIAGKKILLTHGHKFGVYSGLYNILAYGMQEGVDIIIYGHTHRASEASSNGILLINPGSLSLPRGSRYGSFCVITIEDEQVLVKFEQLL